MAGAARCDGAGGALGGDLCWRGQLGAGRGDDGAAAVVRPLSVSRAAPASALRGGLAVVGDGRRRRAGCGGAPVACAAARDRLRGRRGRRLLGAGCSAARGDGVPAQRGWTGQCALDRDHAVAQADQAVGALRSAFLATIDRLTGLSTLARTTVRLVDQLIRLDSIRSHSAWAGDRHGVQRAALKGRAGRGRASFSATPRISWTSGGGSSDELGGLAPTERAVAHAETQEGVIGLACRSGPCGLRVTWSRSVWWGLNRWLVTRTRAAEPVSEFIASLDPPSARRS